MLAQSASIDVVVDAVIEPSRPTQVTETVAETAPLETPGDNGLSTQAQRQELYKLMQLLGQKMNPPQTFTAEQVAEQIVKAGKGVFTECSQAPRDLLDRMNELIRSKLS